MCMVWCGVAWCGMVWYCSVPHRTRICICICIVSYLIISYVCIYIYNYIYILVEIRPLGMILLTNHHSIGDTVRLLQFIQMYRFVKLGETLI